MNIDRIRQLEAHRALFTDRPTRAAIARLELPICSRATVRLNIWRNHNIESLIPVLKPYLSLGGLSPEFSLSSYDDSLSFTGHQKASVDILWLDSTRYLSRMDFNSWLAWLDERLANLRVLSKAPVILATWTRKQPSWRFFRRPREPCQKGKLSINRKSNFDASWNANK